jgi:tetrahydromethanopterin S-methyltransferase subunit G
MPAPQALHVVQGAIPLVAAILLAAWSNNKRLDDLSKRIDDGFSEQRQAAGRSQQPH